MNRQLAERLHGLHMKLLNAIKELTSCILVGIKTRGAFLANRLAEKIEKIEGKPIKAGELDITLYRDDLSMKHGNKEPLVQQVDINMM